MGAGQPPENAVLLPQCQLSSRLADTAAYHNQHPDHKPQLVILRILTRFSALYHEVQSRYDQLSLHTAVNCEESDRQNGRVFYRPNIIQSRINHPVT